MNTLRMFTERRRQFWPASSLAPGQIVIDDQVDARIAKEFDWTLVAPGDLKLGDAGIRTVVDGVNYLCQSFVPKTATWNIGNEEGERIGATQTVGSSDSKSAAWIRSIHVVSFARDSEPNLPTCIVERQADSVRLAIVDEHGGAAAGRTFRLWLPDGPASGRIEIVDRDGKKLTPNRLLPAGILPPDFSAPGADCSGTCRIRLALRPSGTPATLRRSSSGWLRPAGSNRAVLSRSVAALGATPFILPARGSTSPRSTSHRLH